MERPARGASLSVRLCRMRASGCDSEVELVLEEGDEVFEDGLQRARDEE